MQVEKINTRSQTQKAAAQAQTQRRLSADKGKNVDISQILLEKMEAMSANITNNITKQMNDFKREIKQEIRADLKEIHQTVDKMMAEMQVTKRRVDILEFKSEKMEKDLCKLESRREQDLDEKALWEQRMREKAVKIRGLLEEKNEDLYEKLVPKIAQFLEKEVTTFQFEIDKLFRINSQIARQKGLPRDVALHFVRKQTRDLFLNKHNESPFQIEGQDLKVLKDIPARLLRRRREYTSLTTLLRREKIPYRWEIPEGLTFWFQKKRVRITSPEQARGFIRKFTDMKKYQNKPEDFNLVRHGDRVDEEDDRREEAGAAAKMNIDLMLNRREDEDEVFEEGEVDALEVVTSDLLSNLDYQLDIQSGTAEIEELRGGDEEVFLEEYFDN
ncbi:myosin-7-like [Sceloporus undulatus]|uniref:myosin-7-like n=1 Tax=Sceloporus undulatus TaxID=8520 RepID=UPI001C4B7471|nr:myosin-7-like [Sceloporus undulatus]